MRSSSYRTAALAGIVLAIGALQSIGQMTATARAQETGEAAFSEAGCGRCHSVEAVEIAATVPERMRGPDLSTIGNDHDAAWVIGVVKQEIELEERTHRLPYRGGDEELSAIADWLVGLE